MNTSDIVITIGFAWLLASIVVGVIVGRFVAFGMGTDNRSVTMICPVDRADISIRRALNCGEIAFSSQAARAQFHATLRLALDMEVEAGGPYEVQGGWEDFEPDTRVVNPIMQEIERAKAA
jgi:hypothetical protein